MKNLISVLLFALFSAHTPSVFATNKDAQFFRDVDALALNIYHESRGLKADGNIGWRSVAAVVFNRFEDPRFPKTIEEVIYQKIRGVCAFSWYCDGFSDIPRDRKLYHTIYKQSWLYMVEYGRGTWNDPTGGAHSYHAMSIGRNQYFQKLKPVSYVRTGSQGHLFYKDKRS